MSLFKRDHKKRLESSVRHTNGSNPATTLSDPRPPRVIIHGEDRTPESLLDLPITSKNSSYSNANNTNCRPKYKSCSIEDIGYLKPGTKNGLSIPSSHSEECSSIPWLDGSTDTEIDIDMVPHDSKALEQHKQLFEYALLLTQGTTHSRYDDLQTPNEIKPTKTTIIHENTYNNPPRIHHPKDLEDTIPRNNPNESNPSESSGAQLQAILSETPTIPLLTVPSGVSHLSQDEFQEYQKTAKQKHDDHVAKPSLCERAAQTFHNLQVTIETMTDFLEVKDVGCMDLPGSCCQNNTLESNMDKGSESDNLDLVESITKAAVNCEGYLLDVSEGIHPNSMEDDKYVIDSDTVDKIQSLQDIQNHWNKHKITNSSKLGNSLNVMERAIEQTFHHKLQLRYRGFSDVNNEAMKLSSVPSSPSPDDTNSNLNSIPKKQPIESLFQFNCNMTTGRPVNCLCWHKSNKDVLIAGYGSVVDATATVDTDKNNGLILFWSIRNLRFPEKVLKVTSSVTSLDTSTTKPSMLAVGMKNGNVAIFDTSRKDAQFHYPIVESAFMHGRHTVPVLQLRWVKRDPEKGDSLISIALDGKILEWHMQKGFMFKPLMVLKRVGEHNGPITRYASGLCLEFPTKDSQIYMAGSEEGYIYRCSCSYNDQHLDVTKGHDGPVNKIRSSPFIPEILLSCSPDWTVKLWKTNYSTSANSNVTNLIAEFHSLNLFDSVHDIVWSPTISTVFALVAGDGRVEVWDLSKSFHDPILIDLGADKGENFQRLSIVFGGDISGSHVLVTGSNDGSIEIFDIDSYNSSASDEIGIFSKRKKQVEVLQKIVAEKIKDVEALRK